MDLKIHRSSVNQIGVGIFIDQTGQIKLQNIEFLNCSSESSTGIQYLYY